MSTPHLTHRTRRGIRRGSVATRNRIWADKLGWFPHRQQIVALLGHSANFPDALRSWQQSQGLPPTGVLGPSTWDRMKPQLETSPACGCPACAHTHDQPEEELSTSAAPKPCTIPGTKDFNQWLQRGLNKVLKINLATDGIFGEKTAKAIGDFQTRHGLIPTFIADDATVAALITAGAGDPPIPGRSTSATPQPIGNADFKKHQPAYYKWVQDSLNQILGLRLAVDGAFGTQSRAALRDFQKSAGISATGSMNCVTEGKLIQRNGCRKPYPTVNFQLPAVGPGYYSYKMKDRHKQYGTFETITALNIVGMRWFAAHPTGPRIGIGEISLQGGGCISGHASHQMGVDVDIALMRNDGREEHTVVGRPEYSRSLTQELVTLLHENGVLAVKRLFLNDDKIKGRQYQANHANHIHVRFQA